MWRKNSRLTCRNQTEPRNTGRQPEINNNKWSIADWCINTWCVMMKSRHTHFSNCVHEPFQPSILPILLARHYASPPKCWFSNNLSSAFSHCVMRRHYNILIPHNHPGTSLLKRWGQKRCKEIMILKSSGVLGSEAAVNILLLLYQSVWS